MGDTARHRSALSALLLGVVLGLVGGAAALGQVGSHGPDPEGGAGRSRRAESAVPPDQVLVLPEGGGAPRAIPARTIDGQLHLSAAAIAGLLRATSYWRPETRKLLLRLGKHRVRLGIDNPFAVVDDQPQRLSPPRYRDGRIWIPVDFFTMAARAGLLGEVRWDPERRVLALGASAYSLGAITLEEQGDVTRLTIRVRQGLRPQVVSASPQLFVVRLLRAVAPPSLLGRKRALGRFEQVEVVQGDGGVSLYMQVSEESHGYALRALTDPGRIEILVADSWGRHRDLVFQPFEFEVDEEVALPGEEEGAGAPPAGPAEPAPRLVVIDPGHGGEDTGCRAPGGQLEKHLTLEIARRLRRRLEKNPGVRARLVRERDERIDVPRRVEIANGLRADLFLSLHCDLNGPNARGGFAAVVRGGGSGQLLYEDLSAFVPGTITASDTEDVLSLVRWESVGTQHAMVSLQLADRIAEALEARFPAARGGVASRPVWNLEGARMPAMLLEIGVLDDWQGKDAGAGMNRASYLDQVAAAVAEGIVAALQPAAYGAATAPAAGGDGGDGGDL